MDAIRPSNGGRQYLIFNFVISSLQFLCSIDLYTLDFLMGTFELRMALVDLADGMNSDFSRYYGVCYLTLLKMSSRTLSDLILSMDFRLTKKINAALVLVTDLPQEQR